MGAEKGFSSVLALTLVAALLLGSVAFVGISSEGLPTRDDKFGSLNLGMGGSTEIVEIPAIADVSVQHGEEQLPFLFSSQIKFDISSVPPGKKINWVKLWLHRKDGLLENAMWVHVSRVDDQNWTEDSISPDVYNNQPVTNDDYGCWFTEGYTRPNMVRVDDQFLADYVNSNNYFTVRLENFKCEAHYCYAHDDYLMVGYWGNPLHIRIFYPKEAEAGIYCPTLQVSYSPIIEGAEYLVITREMFLKALTPLINMKSQRMSVKVVTVDNIVENCLYPGRDIPEMIRNCIKAHHENENTKWVLLGGDVDLDDLESPILDENWELPIRCLLDLNTPTELYYAALDGSWDTDNDNRFGEDWREIDWGADVYVGRIPARDASTMRNVIDKTVRYETNPPRRLDNTCLFAASSFETGKRWIRNSLPDEVSAYEFYEINNNLSHSIFVNAINTYNPMLVNAAGHGDWDGIYLGEDGHGGDFVNASSTPFEIYNRGFLMYAMSCSTNAFWVSRDCLGEAMLLYNPWGGAVGYVGSVVRSGSEWHDKDFFEEIFLDEEYHQGAILYKTHDNSPEDVRLKIALLGDPELKIVTPVQAFISPSKKNGLPGATLNYAVTVRNTGNREETYNLTAIDDLGWSPAVSPNTLTIPADENRIATLSVTVPSNALIGEEDKVTVIAISTEDSEVSDSVGCIAQAGLIKVIYPSADVSTCEPQDDRTLYSRIQLKFDISGIPSGASIARAKLWLYNTSFDILGWDGGIRVNRVSDQTWDENIGVDQFNTQLLTNQQDDVGKWMSLGWDYVNVTNQLMLDYDVSNTYTSFRLRGAEDDGTEPASYICPNEWSLTIRDTSGGVGFYSREYRELVYRPYVEIIYFYSLPRWGTATFKLENLYKVSLEKDLQLYDGLKLVVKFYKYDNVTLQANRVIENITPPENIKENENVPHPRAAERYSWGTVQIARLVLTTENENEGISTIASFTVHQSDLRKRIMDILRAWGGHPELWNEFRAEITDILRQWAAAPP